MFLLGIKVLHAVHVMFLLGIKVLHAVFPHFLSVVLVHRSATRAFSRVIRFTSLSNTQVRPHNPLQGLQNLIRTSQSLFSNFCGLPVGKTAEKRGIARVHIQDRQTTRNIGRIRVPPQWQPEWRLYE